MSDTTHYLLGSALGAHPYPMMVRDFHRVIGDETRAADSGARGAAAGCAVRVRGRGEQRDRDVSCVHRRCGGVLDGVEAGGGRRLGEHAARFSGGSPGVLHGAHSYLLQDADGQVALTHSSFGGVGLSAGGSGACLAA